MLKDTLAKLESAIQRLGKGGADDKKRAELARLMEKLKHEVEALSRTHPDQAHSVAGFAEIAAHESTRQKKAPELQKHSVQGLESSVKEFEATHPDLARTVNDICNLLSGIGI